jgi:TPR repeat protein
MYYVANDKNTSRRLQEQAALEGTATAHWSLASSYRGYGWPVTEKNSEKAIWHLQKAGELGMLQAWFELGVMYLLGDGIPKDENKAFYWFQKSPDFSAGYLGLAYWEGRVTNRDPEKARLYLLKASKKDRVASAVLDALASIYRDGIGVTKDPVLAARYSPLVEAKPAVAPAAPKVRRSWEGDASKVVDIHTLLRQQAPVSSWLEYGKALMKATRISSAAIAFSKASELGSAEAELQLGQLYLGDWGMSGDEMSSVVEPLSQNYAKGNELIDAAARKGIRRGSQVESTSDRLEIAPEVAAKKFEGQDPRRLFYLFDVWSSKGGC